jgi:hypothetical protein
MNKMLGGWGAELQETRQMVVKAATAPAARQNIKIRGTQARMIRPRSPLLNGRAKVYSIQTIDVTG